VSNRRKVVALAFIAFLAIGHLVDIATFTQHWPFSQYSMYAFVAPSEFSFYVLYAVDKDGNERALNSDDDLWPFLRRPLNVIYENMLGRPQPGVLHNFAAVPDGERKLKSVMLDVVRRFEARHRDAPHAVSVRLYRVTWRATFDPSEREHPIARALALEVPVEANP
jgi:hypothetical protein